MGLVARAIEAAGIPTVALSIVREVTEKSPPPRALFLRFPFGRALGEPGTIQDGGLRWRREIYQTPDWEAFRQLGPLRR
nr:hypothetical protein [Geobacter argillaceus]